jgi:hypothetical protein
MKIPFRDSKFPNDGQRADNTMPSNLSYLELCPAIHNCKDLTQRQVLALQGLLAEKLKNRHELHKPLIMAD